MALIREPIVHVEHYFKINMLEDLSHNIESTLLLRAIHSYFNDHHMIYPELIRMFFMNAKVLEKEVVLFMDTTTQVTRCIREESMYQED